MPVRRVDPKAPRAISQVAAGGVVVRSRGGRHEVCLVLRDCHGPPTWSLPKGHVEAGEGRREAALREVKEETGLTGRIAAPLVTIRYRFTVKGDHAVYAKTVYFFLMRAQRAARARHDREVLMARWMPLEEAITRVRYASERRVLREARRLLLTAGRR